jgi:hypothetical protein
MRSNALIEHLAAEILLWQEDFPFCCLSPKSVLLLPDPGPLVRRVRIESKRRFFVPIRHASSTSYLSFFRKSHIRGARTLPPFTLRLIPNLPQSACV